MFTSRGTMPPMTTTASPRHILAINDDRDILRVYTELLTDEGYVVSVDVIPPSDLSPVHAVSPDLIVLDLIVGNQERGTAFLELLKSDPATRTIPVIVCSADTQRLAELAELLRAWDCDVVTKPFDINVFIAAIEAGLEKRVASPEV